jgi:hypothetical protein
LIGHAVEPTTKLAQLILTRRANPFVEVTAGHKLEYITQFADRL